MNAEERIRQAVTKLQDLACWHVGTGGAVGTSFTLDLGERVIRAEALTNPAVSEEFRRYQGEHILMVWCSWRLDGPQDALASSDSSCETASETLQHQLTNRKFLRMNVSSRTLDALLEFDGDLQLRIFCDRFAGDGWSGMNWQLETGQNIIVVGPGYRSSIEAR